MTGFEPRTSGIGSDRSTNWATTTARLLNTRCLFFLYIDDVQSDQMGIFRAKMAQVSRDVFGYLKNATYFGGNLCGYILDNFRDKGLIFIHPSDHTDFLFPLLVTLTTWRRWDNVRQTVATFWRTLQKNRLLFTLPSGHTDNSNDKSFVKLGHFLLT